MRLLNRDELKKCPRCGNPMIRIVYNEDTLEILIEDCMMCEWVWRHPSIGVSYQLDGKEYQG
jgi:hypothetical protein